MKKNHVLRFTSTIRLDKRFNEIISAMSISSKYLYNEMLYISRQNYFNHSGNQNSDSKIKFQNSFADFKSPDVYHYMKESDNYKKLPVSTAQFSCLAVMQDMRSFFGLLKAKAEGKIDKKVNLPHYKKKENLFTLAFASGNFKIYENKIVLTTPKSLTYFNTELNQDLTVTSNEKITFTLPPYLLYKKINYIEIVPTYGGWNAHIIYEKAFDLQTVDENQYMSIDLGINNFAATLKSSGEAIIYNGKGMKAKNQYYNKIKAKLMSNKSKSNCKKEKDGIQKQIWRISQDRKGYIKEKLAKIAKTIIEDCLDNNIGSIVVGLNEGWKDNCNMGKRTNQKFTSIPHSRFIDVLAYMGKLKGIKVSTVNESHTSKCDSLAGEIIGHHDTYLGKRIKRGLFKSSIGQVLNADINGAFNILRRFLHVSRKSRKHQSKVFDQILCSGCIQRPRVVSL